MNEALERILAGQESLSGILEFDSWQSLTFRLVASLLMGLVVGYIFRASRATATSRDDQAMFTTLVLLTILICMVTTVVGNSIARAFSLAGALSIVRFRTVVEDTRDTAFVVFAVVVGMAIGCGHWAVPLAGIPVVGIATLGMRILTSTHLSRQSSTPSVRNVTLRVRAGLGVDVSAVLQNSMTEHAATYRCAAAETAKQGAAIEVTYFVSLASTTDLATWTNGLNRLEGIQSVSVHEQ